MTARTVMCLHGYGVRGFFWDPVRTQLEEVFPEVVTPDLNMSDLESLIESTKAMVSSKSKLDRRPVHLIGHSLGGVIAAICARDLGPSVVSKVVVLAAPFGERRELPGKLVQFLLRHRLIPELLARPRFFSAQTPPERQKELFSRSVPESKLLQHELLQPVWFHTGMFDTPLAQPCLMVYSVRDRIVASAEARDFGEALGAELLELGQNENVGHDDFVWAPAVAGRLVHKIVAFLKE